jgi:hypothetical protein
MPQYPLLSQDYNKIIKALIINEAVKATKYVNPKFVIKAKRKVFNGKIDKRGNIEIILTIGKPNFNERLFIKQAIRAGEPFPVKKIQLKHSKL